MARRFTSVFTGGREIYSIIIEIFNGHEEENEEKKKEENCYSNTCFPNGQPTQRDARRRGSNVARPVEWTNERKGELREDEEEINVKNELGTRTMRKPERHLAVFDITVTTGINTLN